MENVFSRKKVFLPCVLTVCVLALNTCDSQKSNNPRAKYDYQYKHRVKEIFWAQNLSPRKVDKASVALQLPNANTVMQEVVVAAMPENSNLFTDVYGVQSVNVQLADVRPGERREIVVEYDVFYQPLTRKINLGEEKTFLPDKQDFLSISKPDEESSGDPAAIGKVSGTAALMVEVEQYWEANKERIFELPRFEGMSNNQFSRQLLKMTVMANILALNNHNPALYVGWRCKELAACIGNELYAWLYYQVDGKELIAPDMSGEMDGADIRLVLRQIDSVENAIGFARNPVRLVGSGITVVKYNE